MRASPHVPVKTCLRLWTAADAGRTFCQSRGGESGKDSCGKEGKDEPRGVHTADLSLISDGMGASGYMQQA